MLVGKVGGGGADFILPQAFCYSLDGPLYGQEVVVGELNERFADLRQAVALSETRLKTEVRSVLAEVERWLESPVGPAPLPKRELISLQELYRFSVRLFGSNAS